MQYHKIIGLGVNSKGPRNSPTIYSFAHTMGNANITLLLHDPCSRYFVSKQEQFPDYIAFLLASSFLPLFHHSLIHSLIRSLIHSFTHSFIHCILLFLSFFDPLFVYSFLRSFVCSFLSSFLFLHQTVLIIESEFLSSTVQTNYKNAKRSRNYHISLLCSLYIYFLYTHKLCQVLQRAVCLDCGHVKDLQHSH